MQWDNGLPLPTVEASSASMRPTNLMHLLKGPSAHQSPIEAHIVPLEDGEKVTSNGKPGSELANGITNLKHLLPDAETPAGRPRLTNLLHLLKAKSASNALAKVRAESPRVSQRVDGVTRESTSSTSSRSASADKRDKKTGRHEKKTRNRSHSRSARKTSHSRSQARRKRNDGRKHSRSRSKSRRRSRTRNSKRSRSHSRRRSLSRQHSRSQTLQPSKVGSGEGQAVPNAKPHEVPTLAVDLAESVASAAKLAAELRKKRVVTQMQKVANSELNGFEHMASAPPPSDENKTYKSLTLQAIQIRALLGKGGATINDIRRRSGSDIKIHHPPSEPEGTVSIVGNAELAQSIIAQHLSFKGCPMAHGTA